MTGHKLPKNTKRRDTNSEDWSAIADRMQLIFETLIGDTHGATTVTVDYAAVHRVLAYCRHMAQGGKEDLRPDGAWVEMIEFLYRHNQCMNWVLTGDPKSMILELAMHTSSQRRPRLRVV
jgi:hypothetical protein